MKHVCFGERKLSFPAFVCLEMNRKRKQDTYSTRKTRVQKRAVRMGKAENTQNKFVVF